MSGQSASPIERSEVIALPTLRLSAACAAGSRVWISAQVRRDPAQPLERRVLGLDARVLQALRHLRQERLADAAPVEQGQHRVEAARADRPRCRSQQRLATSRAALLAATRSASRRRFSISTTRRVVGSAQSSPSVSSRASS